MAGRYGTHSSTHIVYEVHRSLTYATAGHKSVCSPPVPGEERRPSAAAAALGRSASSRLRSPSPSLPSRCLPASLHFSPLLSCPVPDVENRASLFPFVIIIIFFFVLLFFFGNSRGVEGERGRWVGSEKGPQRSNERVIMSSGGTRLNCTCLSPNSGTQRFVECLLFPLSTPHLSSHLTSALLEGGPTCCLLR